METRQEKDRYNMIIPEFKGLCCENCFKPLLDGSARFNHHVSRGGINFTLSFIVCQECIGEVIQYRHKIRPVSEMTAQLKHEQELRLYYLAYDKINYKN